LRVHPLVTVKKAASLLGVDKRTIREKLRAGELRGELRRVGMKDKWFVYSGEVDFLIENHRIPELEARAERTSLEGMNPLFEEKSEDTESDNIISANCAGNSNVQDLGNVTLAEDSMITEAIPAVVERNKPGQLQMPFEQVIEIMTRHFSLRLCEEQDKLEELRRAVVNQSVAISEIPALRAKLSEQEDNNRDLRQELHNLKNQIEVMQRPFTTRIGDWFKKNLK